MAAPAPLLSKFLILDIGVLDSFKRSRSLWTRGPIHPRPCHGQLGSRPMNNKKENKPERPNNIKDIPKLVRLRRDLFATHFGFDPT